MEGEYEEEWYFLVEFEVLEIEASSDHHETTHIRYLRDDLADSDSPIDIHPHPDFSERSRPKSTLYPLERAECVIPAHHFDPESIADNEGV